MLIAGIGYQGRSPDDLVAALRAASIVTVIDVRELPWSRRPEFSKRRLELHLAAAGIRYVHLRAAGNPRQNRVTARSAEECMRRYREHLADAPEVLHEILGVAEREPVALLCYEAAWEDCHRSILMEQLASIRAGLEVLAL